MTDTNLTNPRFPHYCVITRNLVSDPMEDTDASGFNSAMDDEAVVIENEVESTPKKKEIYKGKCRSYNRETVADNGDVVTSYRGLALPVLQDEWTADTIPCEGDVIEVQRKGYKECGIVVDKTPGNFGTHLIWKYARN